MTNPRRITTIVAFVAVVGVALVLGDPSGSDESSDPAPASPSPTSAAPSDVPLESFCETFEAMAAAHNNHLANGTPESLAEVTEAGEAVLELAPGTPMPPPAREGLAYFVDGVLGREAEPVPESSSDAFSQFLEVGCRPGM